MQTVKVKFLCDPRSTLKCNTFGSGFLPGRRSMLRIGQVAATVPVCPASNIAFFVLVTSSA